MANTLKFGDGQWATKYESTLAYNDENGNFKPLPFLFERRGNATRVNKEGLIEIVGENIPRIDFLNDSNGALLLEPSRTNVITHSDAIQSVGFSGVGTSIQADVTISPDGTTNADLHKENTANGSHFMFKDFNLSSGQTYSISVFAKSNGVNRNLRFGDGGVGWSSGFNVNFDLTNGTASSGGVIKSYGNGWYRCSVVGTTSATTSRLIVYNILNTSTSYQGDGSSGVFLYGLQLEQGSYPTSYIKTTSAAVTRLRDLSDTQNLSHVIGQTEGVIFYDAILVHKSTSTSEDLFELSIDDGSNNNAFFINNYNNTLTIILKSGGSNSFYNNSFNPTEGARYKLAFAYKQNDFALYINGNQIATDSSGTVPTMNQITFGNYYNNSVYLSSSVKINDFKLYNTRLSNSELAALTQV
jgi:hypothetical protein